jgi:hypothetical protein
MDKKMMGWTAVVVGLLMAATEFWAWNGNFNYLWAVLVLVWGIMDLK